MLTTTNSFTVDSYCFPDGVPVKGPFRGAESGPFRRAKCLPDLRAHHRAHRQADCISNRGAIASPVAGPHCGAHHLANPEAHTPPNFCAYGNADHPPHLDPDHPAHWGPDHYPRVLHLLLS